MEREPRQEESKNFDKIENFRELFNFINSQKLDKEYQGAYAEGAQLAKELVGSKSKSSWSPIDFETDFKEKYPNISQGFINALKRCVENYNPPVNVPSEPLWP